MNMYNRIIDNGVNVEALLATKSPEQRGAWLKGLLQADWPHPMVIPLTL